MKTKTSKIIASALVMTFFCWQTGYSLPVGWEVVEGSASFEQIDDTTLNITASSNSIINYQSFNIAAGETVNFILPSLDSYNLSRVIGGEGSDILGNLLSNGNIILVNTAGIHFGEMANVDVSGIIASTLNITNQDFMNGNFEFSGVGDPTASVSSILNEGLIKARDGGMAVLVSNAIENRGTIQANLGTVALAAGNLVTVGISPNGMISIGIEEETAQTILDHEGNPITDQIKNAGDILAGSGVIVLSAKAAYDLFEKAINTEGIIRANTAVVGQDGSIELIADGHIFNSGALEADLGNIKIETVKDIESSGLIKAEKLEERGYTFRLVGGTYDVRNTFMDNLDGAAYFNGTDLFGGGTFNDPGDINFEDTITLDGDYIFNAGTGGSGAIIMDSESSFVGAGHNLTLKTKDSATLWGITGVNALTLDATSGTSASFTMNASITTSGAFNLQNSTLNTNMQNLNIGGVATIGGTDSVLNASYGTHTFQDNLQITGNDAVFNGESSNITINGGLGIFNTGEFKAPMVSGSLKIAKNFFADTNGSAVFTHNSGTVEFIGTDTSVIRVKPFSGDGSPGGTLTFYNLVSTAAGKEIRFDQDDTFVIENQFKMQGNAQNAIKLDVNGGLGLGYWKLNLQTGATTDLSHVRIRHSDASTSSEMLTCLNSGCVDLGGNSNWEFPAADITEPIVDPLVDDATETVDETINTIGDDFKDPYVDPAYDPGAGDYYDPGSGDYYDPGYNPGTGDYYDPAAGTGDYRTPEGDNYYKDPDGGEYYSDPNGGEFYKSPTGEEYYKSPEGGEYYRDTTGEYYKDPASGDYMPMDETQRPAELRSPAAGPNTMRADQPRTDSKNYTDPANPKTGTMKKSPGSASAPKGAGNPKGSAADGGSGGPDGPPNAKDDEVKKTDPKAGKKQAPQQNKKTTKKQNKPAAEEEQKETEESAENKEEETEAAEEAAAGAKEIQGKTQVPIADVCSLGTMGGSACQQRARTSVEVFEGSVAILCDGELCGMVEAGMKIELQFDTKEVAPQALDADKQAYGQDLYNEMTQGESGLFS